MHITDLLMKHSTPMFAPADGGDGGAPAPAAPTPPPAAAAPAADGATPPAPAAAAPSTALGAKPDDAAPADGEPKLDADGKPIEAEPAKTAEDAAAEAAPEEFKISAPEGLEAFQGEFDTFTTEAVAWMDANKEATPADALKWAAERQANLVNTNALDANAAFNRQVETWEGEAKADPVIGGDAYDANVATAMIAIKEYGSPELTEILDQSGLGSHPAMIAFALKAAGPLSDGPVIKPTGASGKQTFAEAMYPKK